MKSMQTPLVAIILMTNFYRAGGGGTGSATVMTYTFCKPSYKISYPWEVWWKNMNLLWHSTTFCHFFLVFLQRLIYDDKKYFWTILTLAQMKATTSTRNTYNFSVHLCMFFVLYIYLCLVINSKLPYEY